MRDFFSDREVDELQAAADARREARAGLPDGAPAGTMPPTESVPGDRQTVARRGTGPALTLTST